MPAVMSLQVPFQSQRPPQQLRANALTHAHLKITSFGIQLGNTGKFRSSFPITASLTISGDLPVISALPAVESRLTNPRWTTVVCQPRNCAVRLTSAPQVFQVTGQQSRPERDRPAGTVEDAEEIALVVNFATRWIGLIMMTTLLAGSVAAEDLPLPDPDGLELPYESSMPSEFGEEPMPMGDARRRHYDESRGAEPARRAVADMPMHDAMDSGPQLGSRGRAIHGRGLSFRAITTDDYGAEEAAYYPWDGQPAPIESSGTWLNRGVWYAEADVVVLYRIWQRAGRPHGGARCKRQQSRTSCRRAACSTRIVRFS